MSTEWAKALDALKPYVFKIRTPRGSGTGFQISFSKKSNFCGVATALHVIQHAYEWEDPIKLTHYVSGKTLILRKPERVIFTYENIDLAFILFNKKDIPLNSENLPMIAEGQRIKQGVLMGWCGFPAVAPNDLCFFTGHSSSWLEDQGSYLVDGVAINGVSGGPAFTTGAEKPKLCGVVSAYIPNRATGESLPGVCLIRDVGPYQDILKKISSLEQAEEAKAAAGNVEPDKTKNLEENGSQGSEKPIQKKKRVKKRKAVRKRQ